MRPSDLDDVCSVVGYTATRVLAAWFGGRRLYVPSRADSEHPLCLLIGLPAFSALVREFAGLQIIVPTSDDEWRYYRDRVIAERLAEGADLVTVAAEFGLTLRRLQQIRLDLVDRRWIEFAGGLRGQQEPLGEAAGGARLLGARKRGRPVEQLAGADATPAD